MALNATLESGNSNRRFIILAVVLGLLGAILVYVAFSRESSDGSNLASGPNTAVVVAKVDIAARTKITPSMIDVKLVPADTVSETSFADVGQVLNLVTRFPITANQQILSSQVIQPTGSAGVSRALSYTIPPGKRALAVATTSLASAGGLLIPGDYVDVLVIYDIEGKNEKLEAFVVQTILQNIEVLAVQQAIVDTVGGDTTGSPNGQRSRNTEARPNPEASTVTLLLTPDQAQQVYLAEANGAIRFSLRAYGDGTERPIEFLTELDLLPDALP